MNEWTRNIALEDAFEEMHGIRPQVYYLRLSRESYRIRLVKEDVLVELQETMENGLTKDVSLTHNGVSKGYPSYYEAEVEAANIIKG